MKPVRVHELGFIGAALLMTVKVSSMIKMALAGPALVFLRVHGEIPNVRQVIFVQIDVHGGRVLASGLVDRPCEPVFCQIVDFEIHVEAGFKLREVLKTQPFEVLYGLCRPLSVQSLGWAFYASDFVTTMESETTKSAEVVFIRLPIVPILDQVIVLLHKVIRQLALAQRVKGGSYQKMNVSH